MKNPVFIPKANQILLLWLVTCYSLAQSVEGTYPLTSLQNKYNSEFEPDFQQAKGSLDPQNYYAFGANDTLRPYPVKWFNFNNDSHADAYDNENIWQGDESNLFGKINQSLSIKDADFQPIDVNNDGRYEIKTNRWKEEKEAMTAIRGKWYPIQMNVLTMDEYLGQHTSGSATTGGGLDLGSGMSVVGGSGITPIATGTYSVDMDGNGFTDFIDTGKGICYRNLGDGRYITEELGGQMTFRDFNNDGQIDYVLFDAEAQTATVFISNKNGEWTEQTLLSGLYCDKNLYCCDVDKDNDVDIIIPLSRYVDKHDNGGSFVIIAENKGDGTFNIHENWLDGTVRFCQCIDLNADGKYELAALKGKTNYSHDAVYYTINGTTVEDNPILIHSDASTDYYNKVRPIFLIADFAKNGKLTYHHYDSSREEVFNKALEDLPANNRPTAPQTPQYLYDAHKGTLRINWGDGFDAESSPADLTYALRIGTAKENGDMFYAHATAAGRRLNLLDGNCGYAHSRTLNVQSWPAGKYYISVQAVDPNFLGSEFSQAVLFEKKEPAADFILSHNKLFSVGDTCTVVLSTNKEAGNTYQWQWSGATILSQNEEGTEFQLVFAQEGEKQISLEVISVEGLSSKAIHSLPVNGFNSQKFNVVSGGYNNELAIDWDEDGKMEVLSHSKFYEGNEEASYTPLKKIWNSNLDIGSATLLADLNKDGKADFITYKYSGSFGLINQGEKNATKTQLAEADKLFYQRDWQNWADFDNDGYLDYYDFWNNKIFRNTGDYRSFTEIATGIDNAERIIDYNRDGLPDLLYFGDYTYDTPAKVYLNNGDFTFNVQESDYPIWPDSPSGYSVICDFDSDGIWDFARSDAGSSHGISWITDTIQVRWGDGNYVKIPRLPDTPFDEIAATLDVDNNGCPDLLLTNDLVIFFQKDRSYRIEKRKENGISSNSPRFYLTDGRFCAGDEIITGRNNEKPQAPTQLRASQSEKQIEIAWNHAVDKETPAAQMRYNISIRHKEKTGKNAYFMSPLNSEKNQVNIPSPVRLLAGNKIVIPASVLPAGEYEVKVQGVDAWMMPSDFSETYMLTVMAQTGLEMPTSTGIGKEVPVIIHDNSGQAVDFDTDATARKNETGNGYYVSWSTEGLKTVRAGSSSAQIYVYPTPEGAFLLPENTLAEARVVIETQNAISGSWSITCDRGAFTQPAEPVEGSDMIDMYFTDEQHAVAIFHQVGKFILHHHVGDGYNTAEYTATTQVNKINSCPTLLVADINPECGKYRLTWDNTVLPEGTQSINVYKEESQSGKYILLENVPLSSTQFTDKSSNPSVSASRYHITAVLPYGESAPSIDHQPIHVMINKGIGDSWNLMWNQYEGRLIDTYRIMGGSTPDQLTLLAEVSGHLTSYSELNTTSSNKYFAVETIITPEEVPSIQSHRTSSSPLKTGSNIVSTDDAANIQLAEEIIIRTADNKTELNVAAGENTLQLYAYIYPLGSSIGRVNWVIAEGSEAATIDKNGLLTVVADGTVIVRAYAVDGSGVYGEIEISITGYVSMQNADMQPSLITLTPTLVDNLITINGLPTDKGKALITLCDINGHVIRLISTTDTLVSIDCSGLASGLYLCKIQTEDQLKTFKFIKQ